MDIKKYYKAKQTTQNQTILNLINNKKYWKEMSHII